jgi:hypothetical protein
VRVLGVAPSGVAMERYERARRALRCAGELSAQAELIISREVARTPLTFDQRCGATQREMGELHAELITQIRLRAGLPEDAVPLLEMSGRARGLGLQPLAETRDVQLLTAGLGMLLDGDDAWAWGALQQPRGRFFVELARVLGAAGYDVRIDEQRVLYDGKALVRAPRNVNAVLAAQRARSTCTDASVVAKRDRSQHDGSSATALAALLLCSRGPSRASLTTCTRQPCA